MKKRNKLTRILRDFLVILIRFDRWKNNPKNYLTVHYMGLNNNLFKI